MRPDEDETRGTRDQRPTSSRERLFWLLVLLLPFFLVFLLVLHGSDFFRTNVDP
ncbi:MAG: hypothetical protein U0793_15185 [Gemmataceae bacterium]